MYYATGTMGKHGNYNTSLSGRDTPMPTIHGNQRQTYMLVVSAARHWDWTSVGNDKKGSLGSIVKEAGSLGTSALSNPGFRPGGYKQDK